MPLPKELTTVTPLSKTIALIMFTFLPIIAFLFGMQYQSKIDNKANIQVEQNIIPTKIPDHGEGSFCGGIAGIICGRGYYCQYDGNYPDASGTCIKSPRNDDVK